MSRYKKKKGYDAEKLVEHYYQSHGYKSLGRNFTIRGGEIDLIVESSSCRSFIEVKVIDAIDDISGYITRKKLLTLQKTLRYYNYKYPTYKSLRIDVVFVQQNRIVHLFENITQ